jgi:hypothetical protein
MDEKYKNYLVADKKKWRDLDSMKITFNEIYQATGFDMEINTPFHQHNVLRFDDFKQKLFDYISERPELL